MLRKTQAVDMENLLDTSEKTCLNKCGMVILLFVRIQCFWSRIYAIMHSGVCDDDGSYI